MSESIFLKQITCKQEVRGPWWSASVSLHISPVDKSNIREWSSEWSLGDDFQTIFKSTEWPPNYPDMIDVKSTYVHTSYAHNTQIFAHYLYDELFSSYGLIWRKM